METGSEAEVVAAFTAWLERQGWDVRTEVEFADVVAERSGEKLIAEAKGVTTAPGLDVDTLYGQLLRRMVPDEHVRYGVIVPLRLFRRRNGCRRSCGRRSASRCTALPWTAR